MRWKELSLTICIFVSGLIDIKLQDTFGTQRIYLSVIELENGILHFLAMVERDPSNILNFKTTSNCE